MAEGARERRGDLIPILGTAFQQLLRSQDKTGSPSYLACTGPRTVVPWGHSQEAHSGLTRCSFCQSRPLGLCLDSVQRFI